MISENCRFNWIHRIKIDLLVQLWNGIQRFGTPFDRKASGQLFINCNFTRLWKSSSCPFRWHNCAIWTWQKEGIRSIEYKSWPAYNGIVFGFSAKNMWTFYATVSKWQLWWYDFSTIRQEFYGLFWPKRVLLFVIAIIVQIYVIIIWFFGFSLDSMGWTDKKWIQRGFGLRIWRWNFTTIITPHWTWYCINGKICTKFDWSTIVRSFI